MRTALLSWTVMLFVIAGGIMAAGCGKDDETSAPVNHAPIIEQVTAVPDTISPGLATLVSCDATDADNDSLTFTWRAEAGDLPSASNADTATWISPQVSGNYWVEVDVGDGSTVTSDSVKVVVF